jgi:hypothetical protein
VLILFGTLTFLLALGFFGESILGMPRMVTVTAGLMAVLMMFFFIPAGPLYVLLRERRIGTIRRPSDQPARRRASEAYSALAIRRRWYYAVAGGYTSVIGLLLLLPSAKTTVEIRFAGVILLVWGLLCVWVAVLAFRTKRWMLMRDERDSGIKRI